jgi:hypothetical protein
MILNIKEEKNKKVYISESQCGLLSEERGVFPEVERYSYELAKEYIQELYKQKTYISYYSKYKFFGHRIRVENVNTLGGGFASYVNGYGDLIIEIKPQGKSLDEDFMQSIAHEFTHALQTLYSQEKAGGGNLKFNTDYKGMTNLYIFSYAEMQARLASLFGTKSSSVEINEDSADMLITLMRDIIAEVKAYDNGGTVHGIDKLRFMIGLSRVSNRGFHFSNVDKRDVEHEMVSNNYPYLKNVTAENYEKKYEIFVRDLEKRFKWFLSRVYYWRDKLNGERHDILDRNMGMDNEIGSWKSEWDERVRKREERENARKERKKEEYIKGYILNPGYKLRINPRCYLGSNGYSGTLSDGKNTVDINFCSVGEGLDKQVDTSKGIMINGFYIDVLPPNAWQVLLKKCNDSFDEFINGVDIDVDEE